MKKNAKTVSKTGETEYAVAKVMTPEQMAALPAPIGFRKISDAPEAGFELKGLPPIIKPSTVPTGASIRATIVKVVDSTVASIKNPLIYLEGLDPDNGSKLLVAFPCTATIGTAFGVRPGSVASVKELEPFIGYEIIIKKIGQAAAKEGQRAGAHLFQVWLKAPKAKK